MSVRNSELFNSLQNTLKQTEALYYLAQSLIGHEELSQLLQTVADQIAFAAHADRVLIYLLDKTAQKVTHSVKGGADKTERVEVGFEELMAGLTGYAIRTLEPVISPKGDVDERESVFVQTRRQEIGAGSILVVPLINRDNCAIGTITAINNVEGEDFSCFI